MLPNMLFSGLTGFQAVVRRETFLDDLLNLWFLQSNPGSNYYATFDLDYWLTSKPLAVHLSNSLKTLYNLVSHFLGVRV